MSELFGALQSDVEFVVNLGQTRADLNEVARVYAQTTGAMSTEALRMIGVQDKLNRAIADAGPESRRAAAASLAYRREVAALAAEQERAAATQAAAAQRAAAAQVRAAQTVGHALTRYVTAPTALIAFEAVKMRIQFERQMLLIQTQAGATGAEVDQLRGKVLKLAESTPQGPEELAKGLYHLESLGLRGAAALGVLKTSSTAAFMGIADLESVTTALGAAVVTGIQGTENYDRAMGTLNATIGAGNMRMEDLVAALATGILPAAANAGLSLDQVGAALAVLTDRGQGADEAGTRLRMTFALMEAPTKKARKALADMGIDGTKLNAMLRQPDGLLHVLELLHSRMDSVGKVRGSRDIIEAFGGGRSSATILTLIQSLDSAISSYDGKLEDVRRNTDKFFADQHDVKNSDAYRLATEWSKARVELIKLGATIGPVIVDVVTAVGTVVEVFNHLGHVGKTEVGVIIGLLAIGGPLLLGAAAVARAVETIGAAFTKMGAQAAIATTATEAELAATGAAAERTALQVGAVGGAATVANGKVALLRGNLLGLGAISIAPIVIPIVLSIADKEKSWLEQHTGKYGAAAFDVIATAATGGLRGGPKAIYDDLFGDHGKPKNTSGMSNDPMHDANDRRTGQSDRTSTYTPPPAPVPYKPSRAAQLNLALAKNPNDVAAINAKIAYDREAAAFAEKRIREGRGNPKLEQQLESVYGDINSLEGQLTSQRAEATRKAAAAAKKRIDAATKARNKLEQERKDRITRLTQIPIDLQIAEVTAETQHASEARLKKIYEKQLHEVDEQLRTLRKIHASKQAIYDALQTKLAIQQKIDGIQSAASKSQQQGFIDSLSGVLGTFVSDVGIGPKSGRTGAGGAAGKTIVVNVDQRGQEPSAWAAARAAREAANHLL